MKLAKQVWYAVLFAAGILLIANDCQAAARHKVIEKRDKPPVSFVPSAMAREELDTPVLSGLDFTGIAPPETRLRIVEDEPYIYVRGNAGSRHGDHYFGLTRITLLGSSSSGGAYEAQVSLRVVPGKNSSNVLRLAFDTAVNYVYTHSLVTAEQRGETAYALNEVRSPLGLTDPDDKDNRYREYLAYSAAIANPQLWHAAGDTAQAAPEQPEQPTPYLFVQGQLKALRRITGAHCLLTIDVTAQGFPHSLTLTENIARCIINRIDPAFSSYQRLDYLAYYPEYEPFMAYFEDELPQPAAADLAERPAEGCGKFLLPITGDVCPQCLDKPSWPAMPYVTGMDQAVTGGQPLPVCSKCLHAGIQNEQSAGICGQCPSGAASACGESCRRKQAKCSPCRSTRSCINDFRSRCTKCDN